MTIHERMQPRSEREKDLLKYGRRQERERIVGPLEADRNESHAIDDIFDGIVFQTISRAEFKQKLIELIKGETSEPNTAR